VNKKKHQILHKNKEGITKEVRKGFKPYPASVSVYIK
jgi:hypothetical protein